MKILMLTPYLPYPTNSGGQIRSNNLLRYLSQKHQITLCAVVKYEEDKKYAKFLEKYCQKILIFKRPEKPWTLTNILRTGFSFYPFLVMRNWANGERESITHLLKREKFDLIHAETFYVMPHLPQTKIPIVLVDQTIEYQVYSHYVRNYFLPFLKPLLYIDVLKTKFWEMYYWKKAQRVIAVSQRDANIMQFLIKDLEVTVVPNGVGEDLAEDVKEHFNHIILFMGSGWLQNLEAAEDLIKQVFPLILKKVPEARLAIAGQLNEKIFKYSSDKIKIVNIPSEDIQTQKEYFHTSGIMIAPLYGPGGTRLKILGAMAARLPVVTTKTGIAGIEAKDGENVLLGETSQELANLAIKLFNDKKLYSRIASNARRFVEQNYFYDSIARKLDQVYQEVVNG